ncbi:MAG: hypothetical protein WD872_03990 [Pirellulaceae bacterium]
MKRSARQNLSVALFPFLAVLICTMGALIVLLVLFTHQAKVHAKTVAADRQQAVAASADEQRLLQEQLEDADWRRELLLQQRGEKARELAEGRARLTHLEQHLAQLKGRAQEIVARARQIDQGNKLRDDELAASQQELARLHDEIARRAAELEEARRKQQNEEQWYALIPYDGPNGTRRRPIYLECTDRGIVLQPEGVVFVPEDFNGPLGPGNPLDRALRTVRDHLQSATGGKGGDPYPLLVVRPSGIVAYGEARKALKAWDDEFGYELISDNKKLAFGEPDPALAAALARSVNDARQQQAALAAAMPRRYDDDQPLVSFDPASMRNLPGQPSGSGGRGVGGGAGGSGNGFGFSGGSGGGMGNSAGQLATGGPQLGSPIGNQAGGQTATGDGAATGAGEEVEYPTTASGGMGGTMAGGAASGQAGPYGSSPSAGGAPSSGSAGGTSGNSSGTAGGTQGGQSVGGAGRAGQVTSGKSRGSNWGLPGAAGRSTGITRPIHAAVLLDRLVLVPERGDERLPQQLKIAADRLQMQEVDAFVSAVQKEMKSWGLAVAGGYWKPVLQVQVAPDAEQHFADLQTALEQSGFEIERKTP